MRFLHTTAVSAVLAAACVAAIPTRLSTRSHEKRDQPPTDWVKSSRVQKDTILPMRIGLTQSNLDLGHDFVLEVSDPESPSFGQHWTKEKVHDMFAPAEEAVEAVKAWLTSSGIHNDRIMHYENKGWLAFEATADEAEALLQTEFHEHEHSSSDKLKIGCDEYHLPAHISEHVDYITPGVKLTTVTKRNVKRAVEGGRHHPHPPPSRMPHSWEGGNPHYQPPPAASLPDDLRGCGLNITPACIKALYHIPQAKYSTPGYSLGLYEQGDYFSKGDLDEFYKLYANYVPQGTYPVPALVDGATYAYPQNDTTHVTGEADIDIDMAFSLIYPQTVTLYQVDDPIYAAEDLATTNLFNTFLDAVDGSYCKYSAYGETGNDPSIDPVYPDPQAGGYKGQLQCGVYELTKVVSASYGQAEKDLPINYQKRQCNEFMKLALQGHSILVASGDYGVGSFPGDGQVNRGGTGCLGPEGYIFVPQYPSGCPYVTSVGATMLYGNQTVLDPESVMNVNLGTGAENFTTAGGFSNFFPQPSWQKAAVARYLEHYVPPYPSYAEFSPNFNKTKGLYNRIGRAYPDISANGVNFRAFTNGEDFHWYGSSLASPLFASVLTLLNEERHRIGKGPVGFILPTLYSHPEVLNDITNGTNSGCDSEGFPAAPGWDPSSGLGTPSYPKMLELYRRLP